MDDKAFGCVGTTIRLASGHYLDLAAPDPGAIWLPDIAAGLAKLCRFGGQIDHFYSVAEHSVACFELGVQRDCSLAELRACLLHDAAEAFVGDVVKPLKMMIAGLYDPIEQRLEDAIAARFGVDFRGTAACWKLIDRTLLIAERRALFSPDNVVWAGENEVERIEYKPRCWNPAGAEQRFLHACRELGVKHG